MSKKNRKFKGNKEHEMADIKEKLLKESLEAAKKKAEADAEKAKAEDVKEETEAAEEAAYRRSELYYSSAEYAKAADYYEQFRQQYPESTFYVQALFYNALSLKNIGREKEAILLSLFAPFLIPFLTWMI